MKQPLPTLADDSEAETFVADADLTNYDLSTMTPIHFELKPKDRSVTLRLPEPLLKAVQAEAGRVGLPYQRFIRLALEQALQRK